MTDITIIETPRRKPRKWPQKGAGAKKRKSKPVTITKLKKEADRLFSLFIRQKYANSEGIVKCFTCEYSNHWKKLQNGHFVSRYYLATRYDERNCRPQCYTCNMFRNGMTPHFAENLKKEYGPGIIEELFAKARPLTKDFDYQAIITKYTLSP